MLLHYSRYLRADSATVQSNDSWNRRLLVQTIVRFTVGSPQHLNSRRSGNTSLWEASDELEYRLWAAAAAVLLGWAIRMASEGLCR